MKLRKFPHDFFPLNMSVFEKPFRFNRLPTECLTLASNAVLGRDIQNSDVLKSRADDLRVEDETDKNIILENTSPRDNRFKPFFMRDCKSVIVCSSVCVGSAQVVNCSGGSIDGLVSKGSVSLTSCNDMKISGWCSQLRLTDCKNIQISFQTASSTALVNCRDICVLPPPVVQPESVADDLLRQAGLNTAAYLDSCKWMDIADFDSLPGTAKNFTLGDPRSNRI